MGCYILFTIRSNIILDCLINTTYLLYINLTYSSSIIIIIIFIEWFKYMIDYLFEF